ncbi:Kinesin-related protein 4 [Melipona quadrifasciata]|uniref:Kinesin-related protein 4 n=1 Tax=Melipona quadrifasciata TaxID=166423 RepID=A0A0N0BJ62_9HYME|nr:Kinesin-related protein 4 [Melipona quadrifasciata]
MSSDVKVGIKLRPPTQQELDENLSMQWIVKENSIVSLEQKTSKWHDNGFHFDYNFDVNTKNSIIFDSIVKSIVDATVNGFNGTVFCYGQFNSGKTYTMIGTSEDPGIIPLTVEYIFDAISNVIQREFLLRVSYLEICDEKINDLLDKNQIDLKLYKDNKGQIIVNCTEKITNSSNDMLSIMKKGIKNERIEENKNKHIGSHNIFQIMSKSQNIQDHIDYHNSKLTELLQSSLGGNALIAVICTVTPVILEETYYTLSFATEVKKVKTKPQKDEIISNASLLCYAKRIKLEPIKNGNSSIDVEEVESNKVQQKCHLLEEHIKLLKTQIISGRVKNGKKPVNNKSKRREIYYNPGMIKPYSPIFYTQTCLPTIKEISPEKPHKKNIMQSIDINQKTSDHEIIDHEADYEIKENDDIRNNHVKCMGSNYFFLRSGTQDSLMQISSSKVSPSTPKKVLRKCIVDLKTELDELREFTTLEKQLICEEEHCYTHNMEEQTNKLFTCSDLKYDEIDKYSPNFAIQLKDEIKPDVQSIKLDIEKLEKTICLLTNENMEMSNKLCVEKELAKKTELNFQKTINELYAQISKITEEKIDLENYTTVLNNQLESFRSKTSENCDDEQLLIKYQNKIEALKTENIDLSAIIANQNKELENIKESKALLYDHDCIYKDKVTLLTEKNEYLIKENNELSTDLIDRIEENDILKEQCDILDNKMTLMRNMDSNESDIEKLRSENNILKARIAELGMRITILTDENAKFSNNLLEHMENFDNSHNEKVHNSSIAPNSPEKSNETIKKIVSNENYEEMSNKIIMLQKEITHLSRVNKKLSDLKLSSCSQCVHLKNVSESRRAFKLEAKILNHKLEDLQKKFDRKCAYTETLKLKANEELNLSFTDPSLNASFVDKMNVSFIEEKVHHLNNELQALKDDHDKLSISYKKKCDKLEKLHSADNVKKIERLQNNIDQVQNDIDEIKKSSTHFVSLYKMKKEKLLDKISNLTSNNEILQQTVADKETSISKATEKVQILENELSCMNKEIEQLSAMEKIMQSEKMTLEIELEELKLESEKKDNLITGLNKTIDDLNKCISLLKHELDLITTQKNELTILIEKNECKYKDELKLLRKQCDELKEGKQKSIEIERLRINELESNIEKLKIDLEKQRNLHYEDTVKESMIKELKSLECISHSVDFSNKTANEIFNIFLQTIMLKEEEIVKKMNESFERDKQRLEDEKQQCADAEKRMMLWAKELETENEKLHIDFKKTESLCMKKQDEINQLKHSIKENNYEKEILKEEIKTLESDFNNLQNEFDKQCRVDIQQKEETIIVAQKREKEVREAFKCTEIELQSKMKCEKERYEKKIEELICTIEIYKTKNIELKNNIEGLEANEKQLKNIIEANSLELRVKNQNIHKITLDFEELREAYNELNCEMKEKTSRIENITLLLKNKCDMLSEYKLKLETIMPDYEILQNQIKERKESIERYKEEIEKLKMEKNKQIEEINDKLNLEEIKNVGLNKQLNELNSKNIVLKEELDNLKEKCEQLQQTNVKLERKIRNSTSKVKVEAEMEELKDVNKRLQNNLEGASNRIIELQESKNKTFKELVNLKSQYELLSQENVELKKMLSLCKSKQNTSYLLKEESKYDVLLQEKNKIALQLEGKKLLLTQKDKEIVEYVNQIKNLVTEKRELDNQLRECTNILHERNEELSNLKDKMYMQQAENKLINELTRKLTSLEKENEEFKNQLQTQLENVAIDTDYDQNTQTYQILRKKIQELELELVIKNGQISALETQIQSENFPYLQKCKELEEDMLTFRKKNADLNSEVRKLQRTLNDLNTWECDICRRWRINRRNQACQTTLNNTSQLFTMNNEIIKDDLKIAKLEKENALIKDVCRARCRKIKHLEDRVRELEEAQAMLYSDCNEL